VPTRNDASVGSILSSKPENAFRKAQWDSFLIRDSLSLRNLSSLLRRWCAALRSFRSHIRIQSARTGGSIDPGPLYQCRDGRLETNARTLARVSGIETLRSTDPWVDAVDCRMFLMGFDAAEKYYSIVPDDPDAHKA
jgi:hypothetical protein